jgi:hypothetical protein
MSSLPYLGFSNHETFLAASYFDASKIKTIIYSHENIPGWKVTGKYLEQWVQFDINMCHSPSLTTWMWNIFDQVDWNDVSDYVQSEINKLNDGK